MTRYLRFADLVERRIVKNRATLCRWQQRHGFPRPVRLGPNTAAFRESDIEAWLREREAAAAEAA
ncbi:MAG: AlpA family phage regulatory protein [Alphaproteobacteria bacterium]|nr:AlpA family phage regulatory protein [Alphaproteobacteria bacterium]